MADHEEDATSSPKTDEEDRKLPAGGGGDRPPSRARKRKRSTSRSSETEVVVPTDATPVVPESPPNASTAFPADAMPAHVPTSQLSTASLPTLQQLPYPMNASAVFHPLLLPGNHDSNPFAVRSVDAQQLALLQQLWGLANHSVFGAAMGANLGAHLSHPPGSLAASSLPTLTQTTHPTNHAPLLPGGSGGGIHPSLLASVLQGLVAAPPNHTTAAAAPIDWSALLQQARNISSLQQQQQRPAESTPLSEATTTDPPLLPTHRSPCVLYIACDDESLSDYQCLVRQQIELFEATIEDVDSNAQGRNRPIVLGQVGIRCRHCALLPPKHRERGAIYYPAKLAGIYQAAQNLAVAHLGLYCQQIPPALREQLTRLRERKSSAGGGKQYWADGVRVLGVMEGRDGLRFAPLS